MYKIIFYININMKTTLDAHAHQNRNLIYNHSLLIVITDLLNV